jgi:hypothetical protein
MMDLEFMFLLEWTLLQQQLRMLAKTVIVNPRGRPLKYITEKERKDARKNARKDARKNGRNISRKNKRSLVKV